MATLMPMCAGLVGPKSEHIKNSLVSVRLKSACKQQTHISATNYACPKRAPVRREREPKRQRSDRSEKGTSKEGLSDPSRRRKSDTFGFKMLRVDFENCASCVGGEHMIVKFVKNMTGK